jgi:DNA-3-methyladenine glycosylase II
MNLHIERNQIKAGIDLLTRDEKMRDLIKKHGTPDLKPGKDYFKSLLRSIVFQQVSGKAANTIFERFVKLIPKSSKLSPKAVLKLNKDEIRNTGIPLQRVNYIINLAEYFEKNSLQQKDFDRMTDQEVRKELLQIKGIGPWTVDMFLIFTLNRMDVMPHTDLGIKKAFKIMFNLDKLPSKNEMETYSIIWKPYRSLACWYLWRLDENAFAW